MKKIEAIIRTSRFEQIHACVAGLGVKFLTFYEVKGMGLEHARQQTYRGVAYEPAYIPRTKLEIVTVEELVEPVINCILAEGKTGEIGDGKIIITSIDEIISVRTGSINESAL